jgi:accessory gene regulator B
VQESDIPWFEYGMLKRMATLFSLIPCFILAVLMVDLITAISFFCALFFVRKYAGGYHARTPIKCIIVSLLGELAVLDLIARCLSNHLIGVANILCLVLIFLLAPINHPSLGWSPVDIDICRKRVRIRTVILTVMISAMCYVGCNRIAKGFLTGIAMTIFLLCLGYISEWRKRKNESKRTAEEPSRTISNGHDRS